MTKIIATITRSVDGYITGPDDGPGKGLGEGGSACTTGSSVAHGPNGNEPQGEPAVDSP